VTPKHPPGPPVTLGNIRELVGPPLTRGRQRRPQVARVGALVLLSGRQTSRASFGEQPALALADCESARRHPGVAERFTPAKSESLCIMPIATLFVGTGLMFNVAATVPTYNVKPTCRAAIDLSGMRGRTVEMCEASEAQARNEIVKDWSSFSESAKTRCLQTSGGHAPSYVELLICLESMRDSQMRDSQMRQEKNKPVVPTKKP